VAEPLPGVKLTSVGGLPLINVSAGLGEPVAAMLKFPALPTVKVVLVALVKAGAWLTVTVAVPLFTVQPVLESEADEIE
jgi:hypothetical protein